MTSTDALTIDHAARQIRANGHLLDLTAKEYALLVFLAADPGRVFTQAQLLARVWNYSVPHTRTVASHTSRVRVKLAAAGLEGWLPQTWGVGPRLLPREYDAAAVLAWTDALLDRS